MQRPQVLYDGLWRCLCPALDRHALSRALRAPSPLRPRASPRTTPRAITRGGAWSQRRCFGLEGFNSSEDAAATQTRLHQELLLGTRPPTIEEVETIPISELFTALQKLREPSTYNLRGQNVDLHSRTLLLLKSLLARDNRLLDQFAYECMMDAMVDPQGSAPGVGALFKDMKKEGILPNSVICERALAALAVHPDYVLRQQVLDSMHEHWLTVGQTSQQYILLGLLRDGQHELAYEKLIKLKGEEDAVIDLWIYDIFVLLFGRLGYLDEMLQLFVDRKRERGPDAIFYNLAYYVLDVCSNACHYAGTTLAWTVAVRNGLMKPSDGILENVLVTASREGDSDMASEVHSMMSSRGRVYEHHYDALVEAFAKDDNLDGAIRMVRIMARSCDHVGRSHTRPIYSLLLRKQHLLDDATRAVRSEAEESPLPYALFGAVIEATALIRGSEAAVDLYRDVEKLTGRSDHHYRTIQDMLIYCDDKELRSSLLAEYKKKVNLGLPSSLRQPWALNKLMSVFLETEELQLAVDTAKNYVQQHASKGAPIPWLKPLTQQAINNRNTEIWTIIDLLRKAEHKEAVQTILRVARSMRMATRIEDLQNQQSSTTLSRKTFAHSSG